MSQSQDFPIANYTSHVEEESRLSVMTNSDFENFLAKAQEADRNSLKINVF